MKNQQYQIRDSDSKKKVFLNVERNWSKFLNFQTNFDLDDTEFEPNLILISFFFTLIQRKLHLMCKMLSYNGPLA